MVGVAGTTTPQTNRRCRYSPWPQSLRLGGGVRGGGNGLDKNLVSVESASWPEGLSEEAAQPPNPRGEQPNRALMRTRSAGDPPFPLLLLKRGTLYRDHG